MKADQVDQALRQRFLDEGHRLVFWHDPQGEFTDYVAQGLPEELAAVTVLRVDQRSGLSSKLLLEREDVAGKYLLYRVGPRPPVEEDWLFDIRLYSVEFHADVASIWLEELGLGSLSLRDHLKARSAFMVNQDRRRKLARMLGPRDDEAAIDLKMMSVVVGSPVPSLFAILRALCQAHMDDGRFALDEPPRAIRQFDKMGLSASFWAKAEQDFGYAQPTPTVAGLLRSLFASELLQQTAGVSIDALAQLELPPASRQNAVVCLTQWRDSSANAASYDAVARSIAEEHGIGALLGDLPPGAIADVFTFWEAERRVVAGLKSRVCQEGTSVDADAIADHATARKAGHWLSGPGRGLPERRAVADAYDAVVAAARLFALLAAHRQRLSFGSAEALLVAYRDDLCLFDRLYRRFCVKAAPAHGQGWNLLRSLSEAVEQLYEQEFLQPLGLEWGRLLDDGFLQHWRVAGLPAQHRFYADRVGPHLAVSSRRRAWVIVSDALRYEAAGELTEALNGRYRMDANLDGMLGVLPSFTALGMASLLPHSELAFGDGGDVRVDGKPVASTEARGRQLATVGGMACRAADLRGMKSEEAREFTRGSRVVYVFHNVIDARGDSASTEDEALDAVDQCIKELLGLVQVCINKLNAGTVWVTADHGFLFQQKPPGLTDRSELAYKPPQATKIKKRYVLGRNLGAAPEAHCGATDVTSGTLDGMEFWVPRGTGRFHFTGGARFLHGGAMPQEVLIPVVTVTQLRGKKKEASRTEKVSVQVLGARHKITTPRHRFELIQTEAVGERRRPVTLRAAVYDGLEAVTSVERVIFDSRSDSMDERRRFVTLALGRGPFDKTRPYRLKLHDAETDAEVQSVEVVIDRSFEDDF